MLLLPLGVAVVAAVGWAAWQWERRHRQALATLAAERGWDYSSSDDSWADAFGGAPFGTGSRRQADNVLQGRVDGREMVAFDYRYETYSTDGNGSRHTRVHRYAVCAVLLPAPVPTLELRPETVLTRLGGALGLPDVDLESEAFNRRYRVTSREPRFAYDVLHPRTMELLLTGEPRNLRLSGRDAVTWAAGRQTPAQVLAQLDVLTTLVGGVPSYVWTDRGATPRAPEAAP